MAIKSYFYRLFPTVFFSSLLQHYWFFTVQPHRIVPYHLLQAIEKRSFVFMLRAEPGRAVLWNGCSRWTSWGTVYTRIATTQWKRQDFHRAEDNHRDFIDSYLRSGKGHTYRCCDSSFSLPLVSLLLCSANPEDQSKNLFRKSVR